MADIGKVTPGSPVIPPVPQDRRIDDQEKQEQERRERRQDEMSEQKSPDKNDDKGKGEDGIDVYV